MIDVRVVPQANGGTRYLALSAEDAVAVARDSAMLDCVAPLAVLDVYDDGYAEWVSWPCPKEAREAIRSYRRAGGD